MSESGRTELPSWEISPIGFFRTRAARPYEAPRQATLEAETGVVELLPKMMFEQSLVGLEGFERIWLIYRFHRSDTHWKPMVQPPRTRHGEKQGLFATRAPYRPNAIGMSCVELDRVEGLRIFVRGSDLLDGTPILDVKPYVPYADAFPDAKAGWLDGIEEFSWEIALSPAAEAKIAFLDPLLGLSVRAFVDKHLQSQPTDPRHKRVRRTETPGVWVLSLRTWRILFRLEEENRRIEVLDLFSGYLAEDLLPGAEDPFSDKETHRAFVANFPGSALPPELAWHRHRP